MHYEYRTEGVCASQLTFDIDQSTHRVRNLAFTGGCDGNLKAISKIADGMDADLLIDKLKGNTCGSRPTSCADQLARALSKAIAAS